MERSLRIAAAGLLVALAMALVVGIVLLSQWGGRMEVALMVLGDRVWVTLDAGRARFLALLLLPAVLLGAALSVGRPGRRPRGRRGG